VGEAAASGVSLEQDGAMQGTASTKAAARPEVSALDLSTYTTGLDELAMHDRIGDMEWGEQGKTTT
jgi:hypothetical protein